MQSQAPPAIEAVSLTRRFGSVCALEDVTLTVGRGEFFSLLGPSGCGKTTLLRIIAGLDAPDSGSIRLAGRDASAVPAHERAVHTVFQSYALFPHMRVRDNVAFGLRMRRISRAEIETRVRGIMELTRISELAGRMPSSLSGGQKQRVALARALVNEPEVLLLDEPLGALDLKLRQELQTEMRTLQRRTGITFIYVTHDQSEALSMSDRIAVMNRGRIVQIGSGQELYEHPRTRFTAQFLGGCNLLRAKVLERNGTSLHVETALGRMPVVTGDSRTEFTLAIRPEKVLLHSPATDQFPGEVIETTYTGAETFCLVRVCNEMLRVTSVNTGRTTSLSAGQKISLMFPPESLIVLED